jgi:hypothetical protein
LSKPARRLSLVRAFAARFSAEIMSGGHLIVHRASGMSVPVAMQVLQDRWAIAPYRFQLWAAMPAW